MLGAYFSYQRKRARSGRCRISCLLLAVAILLFAPCRSLASTSTSAAPIRELAKRAELVLIGTVASLHGELDASRQTVYTIIEVHAEQVLKGAVAGPTVRFRQLGGEANGVISAVSDSAPFAVGEKVLLFLERDREQHLRLVGGFMGKYSLQFDPAAKMWMATRIAPGGRPVLDRLSLDQAKAAVVGP